MTDEAKALVERLRDRVIYDSRHYIPDPLLSAGADLIETQAREIERLREAFLETREMLGLAEQIICEECCPTTWKTADGQPHSPLHEDIRAVLFKHEATRDEARAALAGDSHDQ